MDSTDERCVDNLNVFACGSPLLWVLKMAIPAVVVVAMYFFVRALVTEGPNAERAQRELRLWLLVAVAEVLHFIRSFLPLERWSTALAHFAELARALVFASASAPAVLLVRRVAPRAAAWAALARTVLVWTCAASGLAVLVALLVAPSVLAGLMLWALALGTAARGLFVWAMAGALTDRRLGWPARAPWLSRALVGASVLLWMLWTGFGLAGGLVVPSPLGLWLALDRRGRRGAFAAFAGLLDFAVNDVALVVVVLATRATLNTDAQAKDAAVWQVITS